ncbi:YlxR family protein [Jatrophihabitans telluris]|uniref:YlxR family protein n=1 Tax=Jatrophihabitans telluris TaxID=2038343 RepID=A0ABY4R2L4_9ACTN|nr:YlxR family protein [Jatrophihabitans telluris]UQX90044.1 YlxR family protein [Jatrophihabitans telluris]
MAVRSTTAVPTLEDPQRRAPSASGVAVRTCIGCRLRAPATELLRVVLASDSGRDPAIPGTVQPDPRRRAPGRGAWIHPEPDCVAAAERRRAFGRAFRGGTSPDPTPVRDYVAALAARAVPRSAPAGRVVGETRESETKPMSTR